MRKNSDINKGFVQTFKEAEPSQKLFLIAGLIAVSICFFILSAYLVGSTVYFFSDKMHSKIYYGIQNFTLTFVLAVIMDVLFIYIILSTGSRKSTVAFTDERGIKYVEQGSKGTAHPATREEIEEYFEICDINDTDQMIYGQLSENGNQVIAYKEKEHGSPATQHVICYAPSGGGKTYGPVLTNMLQVIKRGDSVIAVDPDGSIYGRTSNSYRNNDYDVKLLNLANLLFSDNWDCLAETINEVTGRVDSLLIQSWAKIYVKNSEKQKNEDFWYGCAVNLIETVIGYVAWQRENFILNGYKSLYNILVKGPDAQKFTNILNTKFIDFPWCEKKIYEAAENCNYDKSKIESTIKKIYRNAPAFTITEVYEIVNEFANYEKKFTNIPKYHPGAQAFRRYSSNKKDAVREGAIQGAQMKFKIFDNETLRKILSNKGMDFKTINKIKSAYFIAVPDNDTIFRPIASLFFSFFFRDAQRIYDDESQLARREHRENRCIPVLAMMDEFASLGVITGDEDMFGTIMSDVRKRKITNFIIIQYHSQLEANYGRFVKNGILANCTYTLCLGANDRETMEEISKTSGVASTQEESHGEKDTILLGSRQVDNTMSVSTGSRYVYTPDEIGKLDDEVYIKRRACNPFVVNPMTWEEHPVFVNGEVEVTTYLDTIDSNYIDPWDEYDIEEKRKEDAKKEKKRKKDDDELVIDEKTGDVMISGTKPVGKKRLKGIDKEDAPEVKTKEEQTQLFEDDDDGLSQLND